MILNASIRLLSVDPGDVHVGVAKFTVTPSGPTLDLTVRMGPHAFEDWLVEQLRTKQLDHIVIEAFRLYPKLAREQGYSDFPTPQLIGAIRFLARRYKIPVTMQNASVKKMGIAVARGEQYPLATLRSGRVDFEGRSQHERDAHNHGVYWSYRNSNSPAARLIINTKSASRANRSPNTRK